MCIAVCIFFLVCKTLRKELDKASRCAAAATAVLINKQGSPLDGAIFWAVSTALSQDGHFEAVIKSQG